MVVSVGVNVTPGDAVPALGAVAGVVKAKLPAGGAAPPLKVEAASVWPKVIALAVGQVVTLELPLPTAKDCCSWGAAL